MPHAPHRPPDPRQPHHHCRFCDDATYYQLLGDGKAFVECVLAFILSLGFQLLHKASCSEGGA